MLVAWEIWKHWNSCVFEGTSPNLHALLQIMADESTLWCMAGASKLREELLAESLPRWHLLLRSLVVLGQVLFYVFCGANVI